MLASISSSVVVGVEGHPVSVEVHVSSGLPGYTLVGLPGASCRESRDRVRAALLSSGFLWPARRVTINLAPTGLRKEGAALDLPIALGLLAASEQIPIECLDQVGAVGELGLDGSIRTVPGLICLADAIVCEDLYVPLQGAPEAAATSTSSVRGARDLRSVVAGLVGLEAKVPVVAAKVRSSAERGEGFSQVLGQPLARWAVEVAAAGGHHLLLVGSPGAGKTMLASSLVDLLPDLSSEASLAVTKIHSAAGLSIPEEGVISRPPFRSPHRGSSLVAMVGGGTQSMRPGEISCAHGGVLFLDELGEYPMHVIESLRQPLEEGVIRVSRAARSVTYPSSFLCIGAMNPCPCGHGGSQGRCRCSDYERVRYARRLSGPILDRFDLRIEVSPPDPDVFFSKNMEESADSVACRVDKARQLASSRDVCSNAEIPSVHLDNFAPLQREAKEILQKELREGRLTGRGLKRVRLVALTISDLLGEDVPISGEIVASALGLRSALSSVLGAQA